MPIYHYKIETMINIITAVLTECQIICMFIDSIVHMETYKNNFYHMLHTQ